MSLVSSGVLHKRSSTRAPCRVALVGAGLIGRRHAALIADSHDLELAALIDPTDAARGLAAEFGCHWVADITDDGLPSDIDGAIIATPNQVHEAHAVVAIERGWPVLIEKPIADTVAAADRIAHAAERNAVPVLVGHHRRYNPIIERAKAAVDDGRLGRIVAAHGMFWIAKPDAYFDTEWRRQPGAGPVLINAIHDIDLIRHLCGPVAYVQAIASNSVRGFAVEDTAVALLQFASGAVGTMTISDTIAAPWSWELTSAENAAYPKTEEPCYFIGGTAGALSLPGSALWTYDGAPDWWSAIDSVSVAVDDVG
ncbi:MAG: Gfo/Idh/MocA family oxidoreductase [Pseudomonadota bacterium]